jgi:catalase
MNVNRDGQGRHRITKGTVNYHPNRFDKLHYTPEAANGQGGYTDYPAKVAGIKARARGPKFAEHYNQAQLFYNSLLPHEKAHLTAAISFELSHCDDPIVYEGYTRVLNNVDFDLAKQVAINVGGVVPETPVRQNHGQSSAHLSQAAFAPKVPSIKTRRVAILIADGFNLAEVQAAKAALLASSAVPWIIGPRRGKIYAQGEVLGQGAHVWADHHYEGQRSTLFDGLIIPSGEHAAKLADNGRAIHWVREAFGHCKPIGAVGEAVQFLQTAVQLPGVQFASSLDSETVTTSYGVVTAGKYGVSSAATDAIKIAEGESGFLSNFAFALSKHRAYERELDGLTAKVAY